MWTEEAAKAVVELTQDRMLQAQITGYTETGIPEIYLYAYLDPNVSLALKNPYQSTRKGNFKLTQSVVHNFISEYCIHQ